MQSNSCKIDRIGGGILFGVGRGAAKGTADSMIFIVLARGSLQSQ